MNKNYRGFTIVELLVVIVVIGILAAISLVSYTGISQKAAGASFQADLANAVRQLHLFSVENGSYPDTINCPGNTSTNLCLKSSGSNIYGYKKYGTTSFILVSSNGSVCYSLTDSSSPINNCVTIGTQTWMKSNLDVGTMINGSLPQSSNAIVEKYCYNNDENNCKTYGGLYQWAEAVQYLNGSSNTTSPSPAFSGNIQGICPNGFHIPTDIELKTLEIYLNMTQVQADATGWRGTDQGSQIKPGGSSGFGSLSGGYLDTGVFYAQGTSGYFWSSSENNPNNTWYRNTNTGMTSVFRLSYLKTLGFSVRCLKD